MGCSRLGRKLRQEQRGHKERVTPEFHNPHLSVFITTRCLKAAGLHLSLVFRVQAEVATKVFDGFLAAIGTGCVRSWQESHSAPLSCNCALQAADQQKGAPGDVSSCSALAISRTLRAYSILYQSMLKPASCSKERPSRFSGERETGEGAIHTPVGAPR